MTADVAERLPDKLRAGTSWAAHICSQGPQSRERNLRKRYRESIRRWGETLPGVPLGAPDSKHFRTPVKMHTRLETHRATNVATPFLFRVRCVNIQHDKICTKFTI